MQRSIRLLSCGLILAAACQPLRAPALTFEHTLYTLNIDIDFGTQNGWTGTFGNAFATWQPGAMVSHLGFYDSFGDGLANSHTVTLATSYSSGGSGGADSILATVEVPAGTTAELVNGYRWVALDQPIALPDYTWHIVSADVDGVDLVGDLISTTSGDVTMADPYYSTGSWNSTYARYGNDPITNEPNFGSYANALYPAVNVGYAPAGPSEDIVIDVASGTLSQSQAGYPTIDSATSVTKTGAGVLVMDAANAYAGPTTVSAGTLEVFNPDALAATTVTVEPAATLAVSPGTTMRAAGVVLAGGTLSADSLPIDSVSGIVSLTVTAGQLSGVFNPAPTIAVGSGGNLSLPADTRVSVGVGELTVDEAAGGLVDLGSGQITIASPSTEALRADIVAGRAGGSWTGTTGITSSAVAAAGGTRAVGYVVAADGSARVSYAASGDVDLSGQVNVFDLVSINSSGKYGTGTSAIWSQGDFNYDGVTNVFDLVGINTGAVYGQGDYFPSGPPTPTVGGVTVVPEPALWLPATASFIVALSLRRRPTHRQPRR
jgi:autotransporter-associated beta strand protein